MTQDLTADSTAADRRGFYRIDDEIILRYREISGEEVDSMSDCSSTQRITAFNIGSHLAAYNLRLKPLLRDIRRESPATARYLTAIDEKFNMLAQALLAEEVDLMDQPTRQVSLSASGIGFHSSTPLVQDSVLEMRLILLPSLIGIVAHGRVAHSSRCVHQAEGCFYYTAVEFVCMEESIRDLIANHITYRQSQRLRKRGERE